MHFKIVSTKEKRGICLSAVPSKWEHNGILYWPDHLNHTEREDIRADPLNAPQKNWALYKCVLKLNNIKTFNEALMYEKELTKCIDTDSEEAVFAEMSKKRQPQDLNEMFQEEFNIRIEDNENSAFNEESTIAIQNVTQQHATIDNSIRFLNTPEETASVVDLSELQTDIKSLKEDLAQMKREIKLEFIKINLNLDKIYEIISAKIITPMVEHKKHDLLQNIQLPLTSCEHISDLNYQLQSNNDLKSQLIEFLSKIGGCSGDADGNKVAYKIVDCVFSHDVLMNYSWTGVARGKAMPKKSFQSLEGILNVFFEAIRLADSRHTIQRNCCIFKDGVLKHAKKRSLRKRIVKPVEGDILNKESYVNIEEAEEEDEGSENDQH